MNRMRLGGISLDALTDIVSNGIGMLVILSMIALFCQGARTGRVPVPIQRDTASFPSFFLCKGKRIAYLDPKILLERITAGVRPRAEGQELGTLGLPSLGLSGEVVDGKRLRLDVKTTIGWADYREVEDAGSAIRRALDALDPEMQYAFVFVFDDGADNPDTEAAFEALRRVTERLRARRVAVGWTPVDLEHPLFLCAGADPACDFRPMTAPEVL